MDKREDLVGTKIYVNPQDWKRLKAIAREEERTATGILRLCIRNYIERYESSRGQRIEAAA